MANLELTRSLVTQTNGRTSGTEAEKSGTREETRSSTESSTRTQSGSNTRTSNGIQTKTGIGTMSATTVDGATSQTQNQKEPAMVTLSFTLRTKPNSPPYGTSLMSC